MRGARVVCETMLLKYGNCNNRFLMVSLPAPEMPDSRAILAFLIKLSGFAQLVDNQRQPLPIRPCV